VSKQWKAFIEQFRGTDAEDYSNLLDVLRDEFGVDLLSDAYDAALKEELLSYLTEVLARQRGVNPEELEKKDRDKAERDGRLLASIIAARAAQIVAGSGNTVVLLSSSFRLRRTDNKFRSKIGQPPAVVALGPFSYLLSLVPNVALGAGTLRRSLFEFGNTARLPNTERIAMQIIKASDSFAMPWSKRRGLQRNLERVLFTEAKKRGVPVKDLRKQFEAGDESIKPAALIAEALKESAVTDTKTAELREARRAIRTLEERVEELEAQVRARTAGRRPG
jgi:hypothetical protein